MAGIVTRRQAVLENCKFMALCYCLFIKQNSPSQWGNGQTKKVNFPTNKQMNNEVPPLN